MGEKEPAGASPPALDFSKMDPNFDSGDTPIAGDSVKPQDEFNGDGM